MHGRNKTKERRNDMATLLTMDDYIATELHDGNSFKNILNEFKKQLLIAALELNDYNVSNTAIKLRIHRNTLNRDMIILGIKRNKEL